MQRSKFLVCEGDLFETDAVTFSSKSSLVEVQSNLNSSNTDGSFTMPNSNSFLSPYEILPLAQENKYLGKFSYFIMKLYTHHTIVVKEIKKNP